MSEPRLCPGCGGEVTRRKGEKASDYKKRKNCSRECAKRALIVYPPKICEACGDEFTRHKGVKPQQWENRLYCYTCNPKIQKSVDPARFIPTERIAKIMDRFAHEGIEYEDMSFWTGIQPRRLFDIVYRRTKHTSWSTADKILTGMNASDLWHTELADLYYQGLEFETKNMRDWARRRMGKAKAA